MKEKLPTIIVILIVATLLIVLEIDDYQREKQYNKTIETLTSMAPQHVTTFRIYARGTPVEFRDPDPIIDGFFQSLTDLRSYSPSHDTVASWDHSWFLEVAAGGDIIQMSCYIPSDKGDIVVGDLGKFIKGGGGPHYGYFQSRKLFQWYQTYSHRWLEAGSK